MNTNTRLPQGENNPMYDDPNLHALISHAMYNLDMSIFADQIFCSIVAEIQTWPQLQEISVWPGLNQATERANFHRNVAVGHLRRLVWRSQGDVRQRLQMAATNCAMAKLQDKAVKVALLALESSGLVGPPTWDTVVKWQQRRKVTLKYTLLALKSTLPPDIWPEIDGTANHSSPRA